jgi:plastocyanin
MRKTFWVSIAFLLCGNLLAESLTLPAAASIVGGAPFFSDVRAFNTSYTSALNVTATYRCFLGTCPSTTDQVVFALAPRESRAFDDMVASSSGFNAPNSAGGVEFSFTGASELLVVTSRLFSTAPTPTVGMFIPGLGIAKAYANTVLTSVRNAGSGVGFRTNVGGFNPGDAPVSLTFTIFDGGAQAGTAVPRTMAAHSGLQVNGIFNAAGVPALSTDNAVVRVTANGPIFSYAAVIDNATTDPYLVVGAADQPPQPVATPTPTPPGPTPTPTPPSGGTRTVTATSQFGTQFIDAVSGNGTSTITVGTTIHWVLGTGFHSTTSGPCPPCTGDGLWDSGEGFVTFDHTFNQAGTFPYFCSVHGINMTGTVIVNP